jgi:short-subunit dehydrogenase
MSPRPSALRDAYGPWAVVTGASDGIGRAFAQELAAAGVHVVLVARREAQLDTVAADLRTRFGVQCRVIVADLADPLASAHMLDRTTDLEIGLLVAAAGFGSSGPLLSQHETSEQEQVAVNCAAVLAQCMHFGRRFDARGRGGVILLSSVVAFHGTPWSANYAATKAYVQSLAEALRHEWAPRGLQVLSCAPGPVGSGFGARAQLRLGRTTTPTVVAQQALRALPRGGTVRPGWLSKLLGWSLATAPRALRVRIMGSIMHGMAASPAGPTRPQLHGRAV